MKENTIIKFQKGEKQIIGIYKNPISYYDWGPSAYILDSTGNYKLVSIDNLDTVTPVLDPDIINKFLDNYKPNFLNQKYVVQKEGDSSIVTWINKCYLTETVTGPIWDEDLIWCPSQCYCYFVDNTTNQLWCIYLRWRHSDPWTSELIKCMPDGEFVNYEEEAWEYIGTSTVFSEDEYRKLEAECIRLIYKRFGRKNITWLVRI